MKTNMVRFWVRILKSRIASETKIDRKQKHFRVFELGFEYLENKDNEQLELIIIYHLDLITFL